MSLVRFLLLAAFVVVVSSQQTRPDNDPLCNINVECKGVTETCGGLSPIQVCVNKAFCDTTSKCVAKPTLGQSCTASATALCFDDKYYALACVSSTCKYTNVFGPGETCFASDTNYANGGCRTGLTCESSGKCTVLASGASCATAPTNCAANQYCKAGVCTNLESNGASCTSSLACPYTHTCTSRGGSTFTCQRLYSQTSGGGCDSSDDCQIDTYCDSTRKCVSRPAGQDCKSGNSAGTSCNNTAGEFCTCDYRCTSPNNERNPVEREMALRDCVVNNGCFGDSAGINYGPKGCWADKCSSHFPGNDGDSCGSSATGLVISFALIAAALFVAMF